MKIGIIGPFDPSFIADYLDEEEIPSVNGAATAVNTLVREFLEQGHEIKVFTLYSRMPNIYRKLRGKSIEVYLIPAGILPQLFGYHQLVVGQFYQPQRLAKVIRRELHTVDVLHAHWTYEYAKAVLSFVDYIPVFDTVRDWCPYQLGIMKGRDKLDWVLKSITFKQVMKENRITFIANSEYTKKMILDAYPKKQVPVIPNPIDKSWILSEKRFEVKHKIVSIATGLLSPRKNIGTLLEAFALYRNEYPEAELHLVGGVDEQNDIFINWKKKRLLQGVHFHGALPHDELAELLDRMSFLVHPSLEETFGNILLEAMSRGVPCIGGQESGAVPAVLGYGKYGLVCDITDPKSILKVMQQMNVEDNYKRVQRDATRMLKDKYSSDYIARKHLELYHNAIMKKNSF